MTPAPRRQLFLHVGTRKSGTSFLQAAVFASLPALAEQGVGVPFPSWGDHFRAVTVPLGDPDAPEEEVARGVNALAERCRATDGDRLLVTFEGLAALRPERVAALRDALSDFDLHLVVTVRDLARQIPSEWQQCVKERLLSPYPDYVASLRSRSGDDAELFWQRQDIPQILDRWATGLAEDHVHVVVVPRSSRGRSLLPSLFFGLLGVDPAVLTHPRYRVNPSLGFVEAETLRRINVAFGDRLADHRKEYRAAVLNILRGPLLRRKGATPAIPEEFRLWVHEESQRQADHVAGFPCQVHGFLEDLVSATEPAPGQKESVTEAEVAEVAVGMLADITVDQVASLTAPAEAGSGKAAGRLRRALRKLRRRLRA